MNCSVDYYDYDLGQDVSLSENFITKCDDVTVYTDDSVDSFTFLCNDSFGYAYNYNSNDCNNVYIDCQSVKECIIACGERKCSWLQIYLGHETKLYLNCTGEYSCDNIYIYGSNSENIIIDCILPDPDCAWYYDII